MPCLETAADVDEAFPTADSRVKRHSWTILCSRRFNEVMSLSEYHKAVWVSNVFRVAATASSCGI